MYEKVVALLRKLGILRFGTAKGTFTSAKDKSDELTFDNVYDAKKDLLHKEDVIEAPVIKTGLNSAMIAKIIFAVTVLIGSVFVLGLFAKVGFTFWATILFALWAFIARKFWANTTVAVLSPAVMSAYLVGSIFISAIVMNIAAPSSETSSKSEVVDIAEMEIVVQAESATLSGAVEFTFVSEASNLEDTDGGFLYLGDGGATAEYTISIPQDGQFVLWIRQTDDGLRADGDRSVSVTIGDETQNWNNVSRDTGGWVYEKIGVFTLTKGSNTVIFTKLATTSAAFAMDKFVISNNLDYQPPVTSIFTQAPVAALNCATGGTCVVGDTGPGGGIVFYDAGSTQSWGRYLEAAPNTWNGGISDPVAEEGCKGTIIPGASGTAIGTGQSNTTALVNGCPTESGFAAQLADALTFGGQSDWFLPSQDEVSLLMAISSTGGFSAGNYWTSTRTGPGENVLTANVRPVRAFDSSAVDAEPVAPTTCATGGTCVVGDTGPGGGIVFYDAGSTQSWGRYLEAAPNTWNGGVADPVAGEGCPGIFISGATGTAIGTGQTNTTAIVNGCPNESGFAAQLADALMFGGKSDWFLPSNDEGALLNNIGAVGGFSDDNYWTSSEDDTGQTIDRASVRPIRAFDIKAVEGEPVAATSCATGGTCMVGDTGPGGGIVFYDAGSTQPWGRYLEAAPSGWNGGTADPLAEWGCRGTSIPGAKFTGMGTGQGNTNAIIAGCPTSGIAAQLADAMTLGGQSDWFLPSIYEIYELSLVNQNNLESGGFTASFYWSSSEKGPINAWEWNFNDGSYYGKKSEMKYVRPVRAFG